MTSQLMKRSLPVQLRLLCVTTLAWLWLWSGGAEILFAASSSIPKEIQSAYDGKQYQRVIDEVAKLTAEHRAVPDIRRIAIRSWLNLGNPKDALTEYDQLEATLKQDDPTLLHEVALGFIVVLLKDMREQMRGAAYTALKEIESEEAIPYFEDGLSDGSGPVRVLAVEGLGRSEAGRKSKKLRTALEDQAGIVKARAVKALGRTDDRSMIPLIEPATKDDMAIVRVAAYGALVRLGRKEMWESLRQAAESANPEDRTEALRVIVDLKDQRAVPLMIELLTYAQPSVRGTAARGLGQLGRKEARGQIEQLLKDPVPAVRESAAASLADLGGKESVPLLIKALNDGNMTVRAATIAAMLQLGEPFHTVAPTALALAQQNDTAARASVAHALGKATKANAKDAVSLLVSLTADPLPGPKIVALRSLGHIGDRDILPSLKEALHDTNEAVRATAGGGVIRLLQKKKRPDF
jgi:HEAT repeat protein